MRIQRSSALPAPTAVAQEATPAASTTSPAPEATSAAPKRERSRVARALWAAGGFTAFGAAVIGAILPLIPTVPFLLLAAFCFARSSRRAQQWFLATRLYRTVLKDYLERRPMTTREKVRLLVPIIASILIASVFVPLMAVRIIMYLVIVGQLYYFFVKIPTATPQQALEPRAMGSAPAREDALDLAPEGATH
jgi:hypothetical protein